MHSAAPYSIFLEKIVGSRGYSIVQQISCHHQQGEEEGSRGRCPMLYFDFRHGHESKKLNAGGRPGFFFVKAGILHFCEGQIVMFDEDDDHSCATYL